MLRSWLASIVSFSPGASLRLARIKRSASRWLRKLFSCSMIAAYGWLRDAAAINRVSTSPTGRRFGLSAGPAVQSRCLPGLSLAIEFLRRLAEYMLVDADRHLVPLGDLDPVATVSLTGARLTPRRS